MASKVLLELKVDDKGSLKIVQKEAQSAAAATDRLSKSTKNVSRARSQYHKQEKGVGQAGLSSAKSFSKLNQTIGSGSSGLVGAYAVLAANVFAATAAFGVFQRAAQFDDLIRGLEFVGNAAGRNLPMVSKRLKEITNNALSTESAMRATALATGAGFSVTQLEGLTKIAKGASIALGRDLTDALDRLVRGTAKLEPEILDELGIMVRLDKAVKNYAASLNISEDALTEFDRRQAFLNETLAQGEKKYFDIADAIDTNPYDKLSASLSNLQKTIIGFVNNTLNLSEGITFLSNNVTALGAVAVALGSTLSKSIAPALFNLDKSAAASADAFAQQKLAMLDTLGVADKMPARYAAALGPIKDGVGTVEDFQQAQDSLAASDKKYNELKEKQKGVVETAEKAKVKSEKGTRKLGVTQARLNKLQQAAIAGDKKEADRQIAKLKNLQKGNTITGKFIRSIETRSASELKSKEVQKGLEKTQARVTEQLDKAALAQERYNKSIERGAQLSAGYDQSLSNNALRYRELDEVQQAQTASTAKHTRAQAIGEAASLSLFTAFSTLKTSVEQEGESNKRNAEGKGKLARAMAGLRTVLFGVSGGFRVLLAGAMAILPYFGYLATAVTVLFAIFRDKFLPRDIIKERADEAVESFKSLDDIQKQFNDTGFQGAQGLGNAYLALSGILDQLHSQLQAITETATTQAADKITALNQTIAQLQADIAEREKGVKGGRTGRSATKRDKKEIEEAGVTIQAAENAIGKSIADNTQAVIDGFLLQADLQARVAQLRKDEADAAGEVIDIFATAQFQQDADEIRKISQELKTARTAAAGIEDEEARSIALAKAAADANEQVKIVKRTSTVIGQSFKAMDSSISEANTRIATFTNKTKEPFEEIKGVVAGVANNFKIYQEEIKKINAIPPMSRTEEQKERLSELNAQLTFLEEKLKKLKVNPSFTKNAEAAGSFAGKVDSLNKEIKDMTANVATNEVVTKNFAASAKSIAGADSVISEMQNKLVKDKIALLDKEIGREKDLLGTNKELSDNVKQMEAERAKLVAKRLIPEEIAAQRRKKEIAEMQTINKLAAARGKNDLDREKMIAKMQRASGKLSPAEEVKFAARAADLRIKAAKAEMDAALLRLSVEEAILRAQFARDDSEGGKQLGENEQEVLNLLGLQRSEVVKMGQEKIRQARLAKQEQIRASSAATTGIGVDKLPPQQAAIINSLLTIKKTQEAVNIAKADEKKLTDEVAAAVKRRDAAAAAQNAAGTSASQEQKDATEKAEASLSQLKAALTIQSQLVTDVQRNSLVAQREHVVQVLQGTAEAFRAMGPEGELGAAVASASATLAGSITSSLEILNDTTGESGDRVQAGLAIASSALTAFSSIAQAASNQKIAAIDKEIEAEKKRDGKSKDSLAKIKALEGKKDALARKSFERNKKIQMAQTVINTASAIVGILANEGGKLGAFAIPLAIMVGAMGAAQLAIIAGQSYQGGASSSGTSGIASGVSVGQRGNRVDVARSQSARGEIAYLRGAQGTGGPENFKPAFYGSRMRAAGGETTGYMVGEQGPELFVPDRPGTVVSNDDVQDTISTPVNATFNINSIDASGVEDILVSQRGNIIGMIREAANSYGQEFVEGVDTSVYTPSAGGVSKY